MKAFQTNRYYGPMGQRIGWLIVASEKEDTSDPWPCTVHTVSFLDLDRDISGQIEVYTYGDEEVTSDDIYNSYASGGYEGLYPSHPDVIKLKEFIESQGDKLAPTRG